MSGPAPHAPSSAHAIHVDVPPRFFILPGAAVVLGTAIGGVRGSRAAGMRFLAENAHRAPRTVQGWYFYWKTKNYRMMLGGLREAGSDAARLGFTAMGWVTFEEGLSRLGWDEVREVGAGVGTAALFAGIYRLPLQSAYRVGMLGLLMGGLMDGMRWGQAKLRGEAAEREDGGDDGAASGAGTAHIQN